MFDSAKCARKAWKTSSQIKSLEAELPHYARNELIHKIQLLTSNKISKSYGGDSDE